MAFRKRKTHTGRIVHPYDGNDPESRARIDDEMEIDDPNFPNFIIHRGSSSSVKAALRRRGIEASHGNRSLEKNLAKLKAAGVAI